jgi:N-acetyl sugar amidotransferase
MKVLLVCSGNSPDGSSLDLSLHHAFIHEQTILLNKENVEFEFFYIIGRGIKGYLKNWWRLWDHLRKNTYAFIHAHYGLSGFLAVQQPFCKTIITFHGSDINQRKTRWISNVACLFANYRIFVSSKLYEKLYIKPKKNYAVIPCGINLESFFFVEREDARKRLNLKENKPYVLFSSYFENPVKNYPLAWQAVSLVPEVEMLELKNRTREEVNLLLNAVDILLLTSPFEGSPQVIKEAMACNCPIITTDAGDVRNIINGTENCFICPADPEIIAGRIRTLINPNLRTKGREKINAYDNKLVVNKILNIYRRFGITGSYQQCKIGLWDTTLPGVTFDEHGISNYYHIQEKLMATFVRGAEGEKFWNQTVGKIREKGTGHKYDCIIGVSGGTDSSYLMHLSFKLGLRPLAVTLDNGWNSDISVKNIKKITKALNIDLETYVIDYEEVKDVLRSQILAGLPWIDAPTDYAIMSLLYKIARREGLKFILTGTDFRSEGKQPTEWTYTDKRIIKDVHGRFGKFKLKTFPLISNLELLYTGYFRNIKIVEPLNHINYKKKEAQEILSKEYGWEYYGGHHHENLFTKFTIGYWLPKKFNIDKRLITLSAQIASGEITRNEAVEKLREPAFEAEKMDEARSYVIKKLDFTEEEFREVWKCQNKSFKDFKSNYKMINRFAKLLIPIVSLVFPQKPKIFFEMEERA